MILDKGLIPPKARFVRVRVMQDGQLAGRSKPTSPTNDEQTIESRILQARDTLYEEELFHELVREARATANYGVTTRQNLIRIPASDKLEILLDLVDVDENDLQSDQISHKKEPASQKACPIRSASYWHMPTVKTCTDGPYFRCH